MNSVGPLRNLRCEKIDSPEKNSAKRHIICGSSMFSSEMITILKIYINYWFIGGHFGFYPKQGFPQGGFGKGLCGVLNSSTESNYVEKHFLTFVSIKYFGIAHLKSKLLTFFRSNLTLTLKMTSLLPLMNFNCEQIEALKKPDYWFNGGHFDFTRKRGFPRGGFGWGFMCVFI